MKWEFNPKDGRFYVYGARISYTNFTGAENEYNRAGSKNFKLRIDEKLYNFLTDPDNTIPNYVDPDDADKDYTYSWNVRASMKPPREEGEEPFYSVKIGVYPNTDVYGLTKKAKQRFEYDNLNLIDNAVSKGQIANGEIDLSFHVSVNTKLSHPAYYIRCDEIYIPMKESRLASKYEHYGEDYDDDELPM